MKPFARVVVVVEHDDRVGMTSRWVGSAAELVAAVDRLCGDADVRTIDVQFEREVDG